MEYITVRITHQKSRPTSTISSVICRYILLWPAWGRYHDHLSGAPTSARGEIVTLFIGPPFVSATAFRNPLSRVPLTYPARRLSHKPSARCLACELCDYLVGHGMRRLPESIKSITAEAVNFQAADHQHLRETPPARPRGLSFGRDEFMGSHRRTVVCISNVLDIQTGRSPFPPYFPCKSSSLPLSQTSRRHRACFQAEKLESSRETVYREPSESELPTCPPFENSFVCWIGMSNSLALESTPVIYIYEIQGLHHRPQIDRSIDLRRAPLL